MVQPAINAVKRRITGFVQDEERHWTTLLECGHKQHLRHDPPLTNRPLVLTAEGRQSLIGEELNCLSCDAEAARLGDDS